MNRIYSGLMLLCSIIYCSCGQGIGNGEHQGKPQHATEPAKSESTRTKKPEKPAFEYPEIEPANIDNFIAFSLALNSPFDANEALKRLFPGRYYHFPDPTYDTATMCLEAWKCPTCSQQSFEGWYGEDPSPYPFEVGNMTRWIDTLQYKDDDGRANILMSFSTVPLQGVDEMGCGRFESAVLGLAHFINTGGKWMLTTFSPGIGYYGAFQNLPPIHLVKFGRNNFGCYLSNTNGGAGGPFYSNLYVFGNTGGRYAMILREDRTARQTNGVSDWEVRVASNDHGAGFGNLSITLNGKYNVRAFANADGDDASADTTANLPEEIQKKVQSCDSFSFTITRQYHFSDSHYSYKTSKTSYK